LTINLIADNRENAVSNGARIARVTFEVMGQTEDAAFKVHYEGGLYPPVDTNTLLEIAMIASCTFAL